MSIISVTGASALNLQLVQTLVRLNPGKQSRVLVADVDPFRKTSQEFNAAHSTLEMVRFPLFDTASIAEAMDQPDIVNPKSRLNPNNIIDLIRPQDHAHTLLLNTLHDQDKYCLTKNLVMNEFQEKAIAKKVGKIVNICPIEHLDQSDGWNVQLQQFIDMSKTFKSTPDTKVFNVIVGLTNLEWGSAQSASLSQIAVNGKLRYLSESHFDELVKSIEKEETDTQKLRKQLGGELSVDRGTEKSTLFEAYTYIKELNCE